MATQSEFINTPVDVLNRSAFNKSHQNLLTTKVGTLTPVLVDELIPDSTIDLRAAALAKLPPLASDTFMRVKMHVEAFFVPYRVLYGGYAAAMSGQLLKPNGLGAGARVALPYLRYYVDSSVVSTSDRIDAFKTHFGPGTLSDYLGFKTVANLSGAPDSSQTLDLNIFPYLAYARVYDDYYRSHLVSQPLFRPVPQGIFTAPWASGAPFTYMFAQTPSGDTPGGEAFFAEAAAVASGSSYGISNSGVSNAPLFVDGSSIFDLRQRNFGHDYFTSASPSPTVGTIPTLSINTSGMTGSFTIGALRTVNSLTQFAERNALAGTRYADWLKANYGVDLSEQIEGRSQYLGRMVFDVYSKGVSQTSNSTGTSTSNPFQSVGAQYGDAVGIGEDTLCKDFYVREPGMLLVLASLVPKPTYSTGCDRMLLHYTGLDPRADLANQILENVGPQPIYTSELVGSLAYTQPRQVFGYTDRFAEYKTKFDSVHGLLRDGESLESFALQRTATAGSVTLSSRFLEIPTNFLDQVAAVNGDISKYGCWLDIAFDYKVVQPLSRYSTPSLVMPAEHGSKGHTEFVKRSGSTL